MLCHLWAKFQNLLSLTHAHIVHSTIDPLRSNYVQKILQHDFDGHQNHRKRRQNLSSTSSNREKGWIKFNACSQGIDILWTPSIVSWSNPFIWSMVIYFSFLMAWRFATRDERLTFIISHINHIIMTIGAQSDLTPVLTIKSREIFIFVLTYSITYVWHWLLVCHVQINIVGIRKL